ncbi:related to DAL5-allantoate and ureidosuccinate permease [Armillaria ostoyae]|uniref:Related to DAL5-allantoate and ureidosuccinate permease n=1 Tax=Armillaria ostoyae TaxID=47428 RepID=A0A284RY00_ARMOS|nr:related to DAL5-allantoate and ureidosuccinate permease [Armillaria ostoyae]
MAEATTLQRSTSRITESSSTTDIDKEKGEVRHVDIPDAIEEVDETNNVGYTIYKEGLDHSEITPSQNRSIRWNIDLIILPIFLITQTLQFLDKTALNYANLFGFQTDLNLHGNQFNWLGGMVYFGYAIAQYPAQVLIGKYPAQRVLSGAVFIWGLCVLTMVWCTNFRTAMINRFFLGIFEAFVSPCLTLMTYAKLPIYLHTAGSHSRSCKGMVQELPLRQFIWYSGLGWGGLIGSYVSTGISAISDNHTGPEKWHFYILGSVTMAWAIAVFFLLPDSPASAHFFSPEYRVLAVQRVAGNQLGIKNRKFKKEQILVSATDPKNIILFISVFAAAIPNGVAFTSSNFSSIIIKDMGFSTTKTTVLKSVGDMVQIAALIVGGVITLNVRNSRLMAATAANIICVVSAACMAYLPRGHVWQRLVSFWLVNCQSVGFSVGLVMVSSNMGGYTHRTLASATIL